MITGTIAVCTRNRARLLSQCLASLAHQLSAPGQVEVLVVDNGSTDATPDIIGDWLAAGDDRRSIHVPEPGLSRARNAALDASDRDVVLYIDDDTLVPPCWAAIHLRAYEEREHTGSTGGPVGLEWPAGRPAWVTDEILPWYSGLELGDETGPFPTVHGPCGANMSVNRKAALSVGGYETGLGRVRGQLLSGEEADLTHRLRAAGWEIVYAAGAGLVHQVQPGRVEPRWAVRRGWWSGISTVRVDLRGGRWPSRRSRVRAGASELRLARHSYRRWRPRRDEPAGVAQLALTLGHTASALELLRAAVDGRRPVEGGGHG